MMIDRQCSSRTLSQSLRQCNVVIKGQKVVANPTKERCDVLKSKGNSELGTLERLPEKRSVVSVKSNYKLNREEVSLGTNYRLGKRMLADVVREYSFSPAGFKSNRPGYNTRSKPQILGYKKNYNNNFWHLISRESPNGYLHPSRKLSVPVSDDIVAHYLKINSKGLPQTKSETSKKICKSTESITQREDLDLQYLNISLSNMAFPLKKGNSPKKSGKNCTLSGTNNEDRNNLNNCNYKQEEQQSMKRAQRGSNKTYNNNSSSPITLHTQSMTGISASRMRAASSQTGSTRNSSSSPRTAKEHGYVPISERQSHSKMYSPPWHVHESSQSNRFYTRLPSTRSSEPRYSDPMVGAPPTFCHRILEIQNLENETIRYERSKCKLPTPKPFTNTTSKKSI